MSASCHRIPPMHITPAFQRRSCDMMAAGAFVIPMSRRGATSTSKVAGPLKKARAGEGDRVTGLDADGTRYGSAEELWAKEKKKGLKNWYGSAIEYWNAVPATVDGVLGGFGSVSATDLSDSARFLDALADAGYNTRAEEASKGKAQAPSSRAVDCGAGVGRIAAGLLVHRFRQVDVVEPVAHLMQQAKDSLAAIGHRGELYQVSLEDFAAAPATYDCIWIQVTGGVCRLHERA
jgi:protein N-terminal methyltransferase